MASLTVALLGPVRVEVDGAPLVVDTRKAVALLAYVAVTERAHSRGSLADLLWPDSPPESARAALRRTLSVLGKGLGGRWLTTSRDSVALETEAMELDVAQFRALLAAGRAAEAVELAGGDFMEGFGLRDAPAFELWQLGEDAALRRELARALEGLAVDLEQRREMPAALEHARRLLALDPLAEPAHRLLIRLYAESGDRARALEQYRDCVRVLHRELGVPPTEETTSLYELVSGGRVPAQARSSLLPGPEGGLQRYPLVGRETELAVLSSAWAAASSGGHLVVIEGEPGIGKTRLAETLAEQVRDQSAATVVVRASEGEVQLPYAVVTEALRQGRSRLSGAPGHVLAEVSRLLVGPGWPQPPPLEGQAARARLVAGLAEALVAASTGGTSRGLLVIDDAQWADEASVEVLGYLARRLRDHPLCLLLSWRQASVGAKHPLRLLLDEVRRADVASVVAPGRLGRVAVAELAEAAGHAEEARRLHTETGGLPLFLVEYLGALDRGEEASPPAGVVELLRARAAAATGVAGQVLAAAAVLGSPVDVDTVREVGGRSDEETVGALEELVRLGLLAEGNDGYRFSHETLRDVVHADTSLARRRLLHRRAAETLATQALRDPGARAALVADHYRAAGLDREAAEAYRLAAEHARSLSANVEALAHLRAALALGHPDEASLYEAIGDLSTLQGDYAQAVTSYEASAALAETESELARIEYRLGLVHQRRGEWDLAAARLEAAAARLGGDPASLARVEADRSLNEHRRGNIDPAVALAGRSLELAEQAADTAALAQAHNILGVLAASRGDLPEAREHLEQSLALTEDLNDPAARVAALNNLALNARASGELAEAVELTRSALELCTTQGDRHREAAIRNNLADLLHALGRGEEAMAELKQAVAIFAEIGGGGAETRAEIWQLVEW